MSAFDEVNRKLAGVPRVSSVVGEFVGMLGGLARVNVQGSLVEVRCDGWTPPIAGMPVRVESLNGLMRVVGPSRTLSPRGVVTESLDGGVRAAVTVDGVPYVLPVVAPYAPVPTDVVVVNWFSGHVIGEEASAPVVEEPPSAPSESTRPFADFLVYPTGSGKYDSNTVQWWGGPEVWASNNNAGIWVYGGRLSTLAGANVTGLEIFLPLIQTVGNVSVGLHSYSGIPGGAPVLTDLVSLPARSGWVGNTDAFRFPSWWGNHLRDNPNAGIGVSAPGGGYTRWRGVGQDSLSGVLRFSGTR